MARLSREPFEGCKAISYYGLQEIYYLPEVFDFHGFKIDLTPTDEDYIVFLFVASDEERYGYASGVHGTNQIHGSTQVAYLQEYTSCKTDKELVLENKFIIKPAKLKVTSDNAIYAMITDVLETREPYFEAPYQIVVADLIKECNLTEGGFETLRGVFKNETIEKILEVFHEDKVVAQARVDQYYSDDCSF